MTQTQTGWLMLLAGLGMMCSLLAGDVSHLEHWSDALYPGFVAGVMTHFGAVIAAFLGGKMLPTRDEAAVSDNKRANLDKVGV